MADIKLFNINGKVKEYQSGNVTLEKELQTVIENNMETFFGVTFLASVNHFADFIFQDMVKPNAGAATVTLSERVGDVHLNILFNYLVKVRLRHFVDVIKSRLQVH